MVKVKLNGRDIKIDVPEDTPLLWAIREEAELKGTKFGCGKGVCGACTVHLNGAPTRSCVLPIAAVEGQNVDTIESQGTGGLHPVQKAWIRHSVPQCGYCQSGQVMLAIGLLESKQRWQEDQLLQQMDANLCRCGTYNKIKTAVLEAARDMGKL